MQVARGKRAEKRRLLGVKVLNYSVYAEKGDYSAMVRCATDKEMVFYVVAGPQVERTNRLIDDISDGF